MKKKIIYVLAIICICVVVIGVFTIFASASEGQSPLYFLGQFFKSANDEIKGPNSSIVVVAKYNGTDITSTDVNYQRNANVMRSESDAAKNKTDLDIINNIIKNLILLEEAEQRGLSATESEIEELMQNAKLGYSMPEGKKIIDDFCKGAGISYEEYLEIYRNQLPRTIARQKLIDVVGKQFCEANGLVFTKVNPPKEMVAAQELYIQELFEKNKDKIEYYIEIPEVS